MPPRVPQPLPEKHPDVAATWDGEANGEPCPTDQHSGSSRPVYWRCADGHRWREPVAQRVRMEPWKNGDRAACRVCVGGWAQTQFACGHTVAVPASKAQPHYRYCPACYEEKRARDEADFAAAQAARQMRKAALRPQCKAEAVSEADRLWAEMELDRLPTVLHRVSRRQLTTALTDDLVARHLGGRTRTDLRALLDQLRALAEVGLNGLTEHGRGPLDLLGERFWAPSLAPGRTPRALPEPELVESLMAVAGPAARLEDEDGRWIARDWAIETAYEDDPHAPVPASWVTPHLTERLKTWAYVHGWSSYRELRVPLQDERALGRLDLVVFRPGQPDLVIEIDSQNVTRSVAKLELAQEHGAVVIWLRWHGGGVRELNGVTVIDLHHATTVT